MHISDNGLKLIKAAEACSLSAYPDPASPLGKECARLKLPMTEYQRVPRWQLLKADPVTIGWGITGEGYKLGDTITQEIADSLLRVHLVYAEYALYGLKLNQNQFDALVSLVFNIGVRNFEFSTLRKLLRRGDYEGAAGEFEKWCHAGGHEMPGLLRRRKSERALFLTPCHEEVA